MESKFYVVIETSTGKTYTSDRQDVRIFVNQVFSNSINIPLNGCWEKVEHYFSDMVDFSMNSRKVFILLGGRTVHFNPAHVLTLELVRCE